MTLIGMALGMALLRLAAGAPALAWVAFWALTALHVWANVRAMRCLRICSLNQARLALLLSHYLRTVRRGLWGWVGRLWPFQHAGRDSSGTALPLLQGTALTPDQAASRESLVPPPVRRLLRRLGLGGAAEVEVAVAPRLAGLVSSRGPGCEGAAPACCAPRLPCTRP